jgi:hypothetical protein
VVFIFIATQFVAVTMYCVLTWTFIQRFIEDFGWVDFPKKPSVHGQQIIDPYGGVTVQVRC